MPEGDEQGILVDGAGNRLRIGLDAARHRDLSNGNSQCLPGRGRGELLSMAHAECQCDDQACEQPTAGANRSGHSASPMDVTIHGIRPLFPVLTLTPKVAVGQNQNGISQCFVLTEARRHGDSEGCQTVSPARLPIFSVSLCLRERIRYDLQTCAPGRAEVTQ